MNDEIDDVKYVHKHHQSDSEMRNHEQIEIELSDFKYKISEDNELGCQPFAMNKLKVKLARSELAAAQINGSNQSQRESIFLTNRLT